jgi:hypothetical protein
VDELVEIPREARERARLRRVEVGEREPVLCEGWPFVTDPDAACEWRKRCALKRLGGEIYR